MSLYLLRNGEFTRLPDVKRTKEPVIFKDCLGRTIQVGDVLASGQRQGSHGEIGIGIVRGFTDKSVLVDILDKGTKPGRSWEDNPRFGIWNPRKGHFNTPHKCCITGLTEETLKAWVEGDE